MKNKSETKLKIIALLLLTTGLLIAGYLDAQTLSKINF